MKIVFLGPDGVGKSTIIDRLTVQFDCLDLKYSYHYLVPGFFSRYKQVNNGQPVTDPHSGKTRGILLSITKLIFWLLEYCLGILKLERKNSYVIFDRYYYDIIVDPIRYCYGGPMILTKMVAYFIPRPDLLIILDAPTEVIQSRKQEVTATETTRQRKRYSELKNIYCKTIVVDTSEKIEDNISIILGELGLS